MRMTAGPGSDCHPRGPSGCREPTTGLCAQDTHPAAVPGGDGRGAALAAIVTVPRGTGGDVRWEAPPTRRDRACTLWTRSIGHCDPAARTGTGTSGESARGTSTSNDPG